MVKFTYLQFKKNNLIKFYSPEHINIKILGVALTYLFPFTCK